LQKSFEETGAAGVAAVFFLLLEAPRFETSAASGFFKGKPRTNVLFDLTVQMEPELVVQFGFHAIPMEK
jgi:hypothetical protein